MKKYMVLCYSTAKAQKDMQNMDKAKSEQLMKNWYDWKEKMGDSLLDLGAPMMPQTRVDMHGKRSAAEKEITGYSVVKAKDLDAAVKLLKDYPIYLYGEGNTAELLEMMGE